jgi:hypothetical protein
MYIKEEVTDFESHPVSSNVEGLYVCGETYTNWQV